MNGKEITWDDVRKGDWLVITQNVPEDGPRMPYTQVWAGEVVEHNAKWTYLKYNKKQHVVPAKWGDETIVRYMKKDFAAYMKAKKGGEAVIEMLFGDNALWQDRGRRALVIVDVQPDFCEGGALAVEGGNDVARKIHDYVLETRRAGYYDAVYTTQDWHIEPGDHWSDNPDYVDTWPVHCKAGTPGAELHPAIQALGQYIDGRFYKGLYTAAYSAAETTIKIPLENFETIHVVGLATDYCVFQSAWDFKEQYAPADVAILTDLSAPINRDNVSQQIVENPQIRYVESSVERR